MTTAADAPMPGTPAALKTLADAWAGVAAAERANAQLYVTELCDALGVPRPRGAGSGYQFEFPVKIGTRDGSETQGFVDCYKAGHFVLEAKDADAGAGASDSALRKAFGQARMYALNDPTGMSPPYLLVLDVGKTLLVWHKWGGAYQGYQAGHRIDLATLHMRPADVALLRDIWLEPTKRDPRQHAQAVTTEIATKLATLAAALEARGFAQEQVARFLMRVVFSCFAEDVDLLPRDAFRKTVERAGVAGDPDRFARTLEALWQAMDTGGMFGYESLLRFNGHFFQSAEALPLSRDEIALLLEASKADWSEVEPTIFGTLLTRALDPIERHRLGAEYTPRAFIERIVRPTVEEPVREHWTAVQAEVVQLTATGKAKDKTTAEQRVRGFLDWMHGLRVLDPACGSGNFLYVTMHVLKEIEHEAVRELEVLTGHPELRMQEIGPQNFLGIEVKPWAREIAELTLWIGFHQFWKRHHAVQPPEPVLQDTGTLELRDAVLAWDGVRRVPERDRPDPTPRIIHPVTGETVPDPSARVEYHALDGAREAEWPDADFIVGNPPYLGTKRMLTVLGDGYVDALRGAYPDVPDAADFVMYWWHKAARAVAAGRTIRAGLITTSSIIQTQNRSVVANAAASGVRVLWAVPDHVWYDGADGAEVRVAMTVLGLEPTHATLVRVAKVERVRGEVPVVDTIRVARLNDDLTAHADVATAVATPLRANAGIASFGFMLNGAGFILEPAEAQQLLALDERHADLVRPYRNGRDLAQRPRGVFLIDFGLRSEDEAAEYPVLYDIVRTRVKPDRDAARRPATRDRWWRFAEARPGLRAALEGLRRYIATVETSRHRFFVFSSAATAPDHSTIAIATEDAFVLGVLSSSIHATWALAAGARMGVRDTPRYNKGPCFEAFPFPDATALVRRRIADLAERLETHRSTALRSDARVTMTSMYHVIEKLRTGVALSPSERVVHDLAAGSVLRDLHDEIDAAVAEAYGWSWPEPAALVLERLVLLHDARVAEERKGNVKWLRAEFQRARVGTPTTAEEGLVLPDDESEGVIPAVVAVPWPGDAIGQITVLRSMAAVTPMSVDDAVRRLAGARRDIVHRHLETLALLGEVRVAGDGRYALASGPY